MHLQLKSAALPCILLTFLTTLTPVHVAGQAIGEEAEDSQPIDPATLDPSEWDMTNVILEDDEEAEADFQAATSQELAAGRNEVLAFDWNKPITKATGRYIEGRTRWNPGNAPVRANFDWTKSPNYANGTFYMRVLIRKMRANDDFQFFYNHWQNNNGQGKPAELFLNSPQLQFRYRGAPITRTFAVPVRSLISNDNWNPRTFGKFNWARPRDLVGFFSPGHKRLGANRKLAQAATPVDIRFTVVVVAPGASFSGWQNY